MNWGLWADIAFAVIGVCLVLDICVRMGVTTYRWAKRKGGGQ